MIGKGWVTLQHVLLKAAVPEAFPNTIQDGMLVPGVMVTLEQLPPNSRGPSTHRYTLELPSFLNVSEDCRNKVHDSVP